MSDAPSQVWDFIVVGTGVGGATTGYQLAKAGKRVLFVERGISHLSNQRAAKDNYAETFAPHNSGSTEKAQALANGGRATESLIATSGTKEYAFVPFIGSGAGGSSALYGMALERFFKEDLQPAQHHPNSIESSAPAQWPLSYEELAHYYREAEALYRVRGAADPLRPGDDNAYLPPPPLHPPNRELYDFFQQQGLHPYQLPMACEFVDGCQACQSFLCSKNCKNDSSRMCLDPAITQYGASLLDQCEVLELQHSGERVHTLRCTHSGEPLELQARNIVLAAGALSTPRLLLESCSDDFPSGLGNHNGEVGQNLMRHYIDLYAVFTREKATPGTRTKELALNDLYLGKEQKLGSIQSFGFLPPAAILVDDMAREIRRDQGAFVATLFTAAKPLVRLALGRILSRAVILATTVEDLPFSHNSVSLSEQRDSNGRRLAQISYTPGNGEESRIDAMRQKMSEILKPYRYMLLQQAHNNERIAHACGTCRFGADPQESVCDVNQKVHGVDNLYIADSSVFPSSGGINPSLTIAALSLRLARHLAAKNA